MLRTWGGWICVTAGRRSRWTDIWGFSLGVGDFRNGKNLGKIKTLVWRRRLRDRRVFGKEDDLEKVGCGRGSSKKLDMAEAPGLTLRVVDFFRKVLRSRDIIIIQMRVEF